MDISKSALFVNGMEFDTSVKSFAYITGFEDEGLYVVLNGDIADWAKYLDNYDRTSQGINIKTLSHMLRNSKNVDDKLNVTFLFSGDMHISSQILFLL